MVLWNASRSSFVLIFISLGLTTQHERLTEQTDRLSFLLRDLLVYEHTKIFELE